MSVSKELLSAILSMDAYNRGYRPGLENLSTTVGSATLQALPNDIDIGTWQAANFYAAAYSTPYGTVISYRGTDEAMGSDGSLLQRVLSGDI